LSLLVAKLGGSLADLPQRDAWLAAFEAARDPLILVPGGGPFAREVRAEQMRSGFDDVEAHRRALQAMDRFGALLADYSDRFVLAASRADIAAALAGHRIPVWLPSAMALAAPEIPASWDVTSDTLAAWLAGACGATDLLLVKSCDAAPPVLLRALAAAKIVDPLFPGLAARSGARVHIAGPAALPFAAEILQNGRVPGVAVAPIESACLPA
jgi:5-(aminomethyl)-3-furanmethanol phosphate kinase